MKGRDTNAIIGRAMYVEVGDIIANVGVVTGWTDDGVFRIFTCRGDSHDLSTGRIDYIDKHYPRHKATNVVVIRHDSDFPKETAR